MPEHDHPIQDLPGTARGLLRALERSGAGRSDQPLEQAAGLALALRAMQLLCLHRLMPQRDKFPATNRALMQIPDPTVVPERDALALPADFLGAIEIIDLLSVQDLDCVAPHLHRGWQDRCRSCAQARTLSAEALGFSISGEEREALLGALAIGNRVFCVPPPVILDPAAVRAAYEPVLALIGRIGESVEGGDFDALVQRITG